MGAEDVKDVHSLMTWLVDDFVPLAPWHSPVATGDETMERKSPTSTCKHRPVGPEYAMGPAGDDAMGKEKELDLVSDFRKT